MIPEKHTIEFEICEKPEPARAPVVGKWGVFDPKKDKKNLFRMNLKSVISNANMERETAVELLIIFYLPISKATGKRDRQLMLTNELKHTNRPDADNLQKFLLDTLKGIAFKDDSQIWKLTVEKRWTDDNPRTFVRVIYN